MLAFDAGDKFLSTIEPYQKDSYFKKQVYDEHDWKTFYEMKESNKAVNPNNYDLHLLNAAVFFATNKLRESKGFKALKFAPPLRDAAVVHTEQMIEKNFFEHYNPVTHKLHSPEDRFKMFGVEATDEGENIDMTYIEPGEITYLQLAEQIVKDLYDSPPHRKIMLGKGFTYLGCAAIFESKNKNGVRYVKATQDFSASY
jgi:uncharacterized protein YkwD